MRLHAEFTTEPFLAGDEPPAHATQAWAVTEAAGLDREFGPFGTSVAGDGDAVLVTLGKVLSTAFEHGATRVTLRVDRADG